MTIKVNIVDEEKGKKKHEPSIEEKAEQFYTSMHNFCERSEVFLLKTAESNKSSLIEIRDQLTEKFRQHKEQMKATNNLLESVEDTLLNVLLAIRQNEYLQANYPAQSGFPALKVSGTHPANLPKNKATA